MWEGQGEDVFGVEGVWHLQWRVALTRKIAHSFFHSDKCKVIWLSLATKRGKPEVIGPPGGTVATSGDISL